ncbi:hypothetical protein L0Y59_00465, partial [Candidatus Uhrbacteria bacterium]|nr:hypothetical protein [Candidatus Uhrbacteria bacterium]
MLVRLDFLVRHPIRGRRNFALSLATFILGGITVGLFVFLVASRPYSPSNPQPISVVEVIDYTELRRQLIVSSPAPLGAMRVEFDGTVDDVETSARTWETTANSLPDALTVRLSVEEFLSRDRGVLTIDAPSPVDRIAVRFESDEPMVIYDVDFPFRMASDRRSAEVFIGLRPPLPLVINYTIGQGTDASIRIESEGGAHPGQLGISRARSQVVTRLVVRTRLST